MTQKTMRPLHHSPRIPGAAMTDHLKLIKPLEEEIGKKLERLDIIEIDGSLELGYSVDEKGNITGLNLDKLELKQLPESLGNFLKLEKLSLFDNNLIDISGIGRFGDLTALGLGENKIADVGPLMELKKLKSLDIESNQLTQVNEIGELTGLEILGLDDNQLTDLNPLSNLKQLTALYLADNQLTTLAGLEGLEKLRILYLRNNRLEDISAILGLTDLTLLDLMENEIRSLPQKILDLGMEIDIASRYHCGEGLFLYKNPIENPPLEILEEGNEAVAGYFKT